MKRTGWVVLLLAASGAGGCVTLPWAAPPPAASAPAEPPPPPPPPVTPEEVTDGNAGEVVHALQDELDRAGGARPAAPAKKSPPWEDGPTPRKPGERLTPQRVEGGIE
jgi:hypothetical protein